MRRSLAVVSIFTILTLILAACGVGGSDDDPTPTAAEVTATSQEDEPTATSAVEATPSVASTPTQAASGPITVDALWYSYDGVDAEGGTSSVTVEVTPKESGEIRVGFFESEVGGTGAQWRTSGWMAVITASLLLGEDPSRYEISFDVAGRIDGPSAGALMTVGVLAGLLGDQVDPNVTMTGTINPDGTIGPVGGIPQKLLGAQAKGKTKVLVPSGQRYDYDIVLQESVDLVAVGQQLGIEVVLVPDVYAAYEELTGSTLPEIPAGGDIGMPSVAFDRYRAATTDWIARYQRERSNFDTLPADVQEFRLESIATADQWVADADRLLGEGQVARAFELAWSAALLVKTATQAAELDQMYLTSGLEPMIARMESTQSASTRLGAVVQQLESANPQTAADTVVVIDAASWLSIAQGLILQGDAVVNNLQFTEYTEDDIIDAIFSASYYYTSADFYLDITEDLLSIGNGFGTDPAPDPEVMAAIAETLRRGAEANIAYFEALIVEPWAQENGVSTDLARNAFLDADSTYLYSVAAINGVTLITDTMSDPAAQALMTLGAAQTSYAFSATVIAEYYSLAAEVDENGTIVDYGRSTALADMLDLADERAQDWLSNVSAEEPVPAIFYYDNARLLRQGQPEEQIGALSYFWQAAILAEMLAIFTDH